MEKYNISHSRPYINKEDVEAVKNAVQSTFLTLGNIVDEFEKKFSEYIGMNYGKAVNSGSSALHIALLSLGIEENDEVIIPTFSCPALLNIIYMVGASPIICDISPDDLNLDYSNVEKNITKNTKAIILPYMFGNIADIEKFKSFDIPIIEDCCQALGGVYKSSKLGSFGDMSIFSFGATKMMTTGYGGMILTNKKEYYDRIQYLLDYDFQPEKVKDDKKHVVRYNYNLTDFQAALGLKQLEKINFFIKKRKDIALKYNKAFSKINVDYLPVYNKQATIYYRYLILVDQKSRASYVKKLRKLGVKVIPAGSHLLHRYVNNYKDKELKNAVEQYKQLISIPIYPDLKKEEIDFIINCLFSVMKEGDEV